MATEHKKLKPEEIIVDQRLQVRKALDAPTVERYATLIGDGEKMPWIDCGRLKDDDPIYLIDGFHRYAAYAQHPTRELDCLVKTFNSFDEMFECALMCNMKHGLTLTEEERRDAIQKVIQLHPEESQRQLAWRCGCSKSVIGKYQNQLATRGQFERPEKVVGIDGKARPTTVTRKYENPAIIAPPEPIEEDSEEPFDFQPREDEEAPQTKTPVHFCAGGCGTPIWEEMKNTPDCSYVEQGGRWFCSEECAKAYVENNVESEPEPEPEDESNAVKCSRCGKTADFNFAMDFTKSGWRSQDAYYEKWLCPDCKTKAEAKPEPDQEETIVTCKHCGKTTTLKDALDYQKSGWQPVDVFGDVTQNWCCSEECLNAEMGVEPKPEPEPEKDIPLDRAALHVPKCPFSKFHRPKLQKVSNNGYRVKCPECEKEGRRVGTFVEKSWKKAYQSWGRYDIKTKTLEELLEESDY
ncbi:MAG: hypothetical protein IJQ31_15075 [Thermoguttaceae bacterium]|nr:hypothetical protein [Thermoguttaceae bacterium]